MRAHWTIALVLVVALLATALTPARAEAMEPATILLIAGAAVVVVIIVVYLVVANMRGERRVDTPPRDVPVGGTPVSLTSFVVPQSDSAPAESLVPAAPTRPEAQ